MKNSKNRAFSLNLEHFSKITHKYSLKDINLATLATYIEKTLCIKNEIL